VLLQLLRRTWLALLLLLLQSSTTCKTRRVSPPSVLRLVLLLVLLRWLQLLLLPWRLWKRGLGCRLLQHSAPVLQLRHT
jgi:hypothetical protein